MTRKTTQRSRIKFKLCSVAFFSLFIFTQCARDDSQSYRAPIAVAPQQSFYPQQYRQYQPAQSYNQYYGAPRSMSYSNPYDFALPSAQSSTYDNDQDYVLPKDYIPRQ